ncbi:MAG: DinB family protein [Ignavibacteria bacterium]|nr:DinB family protein [Ignavibacteria bacterium]
MKAKEFILEQLKTTHNEKAWFVPLNEAVAGLTSKEAVQKDQSGNHSVWGIVNHLIFWNERWLIRLRGGKPPEMEIENPATFSTAADDEVAWQASVKKLDEILTEFEERVKAASDEFLAGEPFEGYGASWYEMFAQMTIHNAYHTGQVVHLRKQQGTWDPAKGVGA